MKLIFKSAALSALCLATVFSHPETILAQTDVAEDLAGSIEVADIHKVATALEELDFQERYRETAVLFPARSVVGVSMTRSGLAEPAALLKMISNGEFKDAFAFVLPGCSKKQNKDKDKVIAFFSRNYPEKLLLEECTTGKLTIAGTFGKKSEHANFEFTYLDLTGVPAPDCQSALSDFKSQRPDLIVQDISSRPCAITHDMARDQKLLRKQAFANLRRGEVEQIWWDTRMTQAMPWFADIDDAATASLPK